MGAVQDVARRVRRHAVELVLVLAADAVLLALGVVNGPYVVLAACAVGGVLAISVAFTIWPDDTDVRGLHARAAVQTLSLVAITYSTGWGPVLATTQLLAMADGVRHSGARAVPPVVRTALGWIAIAQVAMVLGWLPTRLELTTANAMALLTGGFVALIGRRLERMTEDKELVDSVARAKEARFRTLLQASNDVILVISDGVVTAQEPAATALGFRPEDVIGRRYTELLHPDDIDDVVASVIEMLAEDGSTGLIEARFRHPDGHWVPLEFSCRNLVDDPTIRGFVVNARDVSERQLLQAQLEYRAFHDALTGLANRALLRERLDRLVATHSRRPRPFAILYLDVDEFKAINDSLGHDVGDQVLVEVSRRLGTVLRDNDTAARLGGDEFAILLDDLVEPEDAARVATRALEVLQEPLVVAGRTLRVNSSIGIVMSDDGDTADELLRNADIAMYMAKRAGKGRYEVFEPAMHVAAVERLQVETDLAHALDRDQFLLHYQPIVSLDDETTIVGVEALLRWDHPERGMVPPGDFVPLAEATGHIIAIGRWVLMEACRQTVAWQRAHPGPAPLEVAVNVSMHQLTHGDLLGDVRAALAATGLPAAHLTIELTESALATHHDEVAAVLSALREEGVKVAIDDFGTGYSSLAYLQHFPVDVLKIDRSFVGGMVDGTQHPAVVQAIVDLGHTLDLQTVAEGIEREVELAQFRALACHRGQGYLFARPDDGAAVEELLRVRTARTRPVTECQPPDDPPTTPTGHGAARYRAG